VKSRIAQSKAEQIVIVRKSKLLFLKQIEIPEPVPITRIERFRNDVDGTVPFEEQNRKSRRAGKRDGTIVDWRRGW
jgi:hypothetical protein